MPKIIQLDKHVSELIAAGEVIERPASIVKELLENSIDAGATSVTVEIQRGGVQYIRITDNGCGIAPEDVPVAFRRHATSKVRNEEDLGKIATLGFRGEAMASICAVSRVELMTKTPENQMGVRYVIQGGEEQESIQVGCPDGTTVIVRDLFYNVPARLKFLKKDVSEANAVQSVVDKIALSHPEVSIKLIRENKTQLHTPGNNDLYSVIYAVFGRDFAKTMMTVDSSYNGTQVKGFISIPMESRSNRSMQHFFVNGRYVKSKTCMAALEEAYKNSIMVGKFPACVLNLSLPYDQVDVNVHPSKIEVRFTNERIVFDGVYFAVKNAIRQQSQLDNAQEVPIKPHVMRSF
ncbi:MAG TPA: DNA mismatch repair endonuclease MutL, partial [Firmicutes bacterium]|nr:DNA mismatch repair endonuclease MutL [Bacillota bacterium]